MSEEEYKECIWIDIEMRFYTFEDFLNNAYAIKRLYNCLNHKIFYKWYVYANIHLSLRRKDLIWNFLNNDIDYEKMCELGTGRRKQPKIDIYMPL